MDNFKFYISVFILLLITIHASTKDDKNNDILILYKDNNSSNANLTRLVCEGCLNSDDGYIYWIGPNSTFPEKLEGLDEGNSITEHLGGNIYKHTRELNVTSMDYIGKNLTCVGVTEEGTTTFYNITV
ncbi:putative interleukin binding protein [Fowlpox virus]|nr:putative interleukin binding protein [Fowlpox virus]